MLNNCILWRCMNPFFFWSYSTYCITKAHYSLQHTWADFALTQYIMQISPLRSLEAAATTANANEAVSNVQTASPENTCQTLCICHMWFVMYPHVLFLWLSLLGDAGKASESKCSAADSWLCCRFYAVVPVVVPNWWKDTHTFSNSMLQLNHTKRHSTINLKRPMILWYSLQGSLFLLHGHPLYIYMIEAQLV